MRDRLFQLVRPALFALEAEKAHDASLRALECGIHPRQSNADDPALLQNIWGMEFTNPIGIAAGYDKDARAPDALLAMGLGFAEIGTVTPRPQSGNPRPRVFRLPEARAVINRLGFNNAGHASALARLRARKRSTDKSIVGVNIGANKDSEDRAADYVTGVTTFADVASYFTVNVSSPNTPGLRDLQAPDQLRGLLRRVMDARNAAADTSGRSIPVIVKLAPDVALDDLPAIVACIQECGADSICVSNTTLTRPGVAHLPNGQETGGLSGAPLFELSTMMLARVFQLTEGKIPLIGVGGIHSGKTAVTKIEAGASLIQLYTGLIYGGPGLIQEMKSAISQVIQDHGANNISDLVGTKSEEWASRNITT